MSYTICRSLEASDAGDLAKFSGDLVPQVMSRLKELRAWSSDKVLLTAIHSLDRIIGYMFLRVALMKTVGFDLGRMWIVVDFGFQPGVFVEGRPRTYGSGRAVELVYHSINEAAVRQQTLGVAWPDVRGGVRDLAIRCEFKSVSSTMLIRPFRAPAETG